MKNEMVAVRKMEKAPGLKLTNTEIPKVGPTDVLLKVRACSICGTDVHIHDWTHPWNTRVNVPRTLGHEFAGDVVEIGKDVKSISVGDYVSAESHISCYNCYNCNTGNPHICRNLKSLGIDVDGGYAQYVSIPEKNAWKNHEGMPPEVAALQEPMGNAVYTVSEGNVFGKTVAIFGAGPVGLMATNIAKASGASKIIVVDINEARLGIAKKMGADVTVNSGKEDSIKVIKDLTNGLGSDVFLEMSGAQAAITQGLKALRSGGRAVLLGLPSKDISVDWSSDIVLKLISMQAIYGRKVETWHQMAGLMKSKLVDVTPVITHRFKLEEFDKAFEAIKSGGAAKVVMFPPKA